MQTKSAIWIEGIMKIPEVERDGQDFLGWKATFDEQGLLFSTATNVEKLMEAPFWVLDATFTTFPTFFR